MQNYDLVTMAKQLDLFDFREFAPFNGASFGIFRGTGPVPEEWELHPDTDEWLMVLEGSVTVEILTDTETHRIPLTAGHCVVVPKGHWHRHTDVRDVIEIFLTPGRTENSTAVDPRHDLHSRSQ